MTTSILYLPSLPLKHALFCFLIPPLFIFVLLLIPPILAFLSFGAAVTTIAAFIGLFVVLLYLAQIIVTAGFEGVQFVVKFFINSIIRLGVKLRGIPTVELDNFDQQLKSDNVDTSLTSKAVVGTSLNGDNNALTWPEFSPDSIYTVYRPPKQTAYRQKFAIDHTGEIPQRVKDHLYRRYIPSKPSSRPTSLQPLPTSIPSNLNQSADLLTSSVDADVRSAEANNPTSEQSYLGIGGTYCSLNSLHAVGAGSDDEDEAEVEAESDYQSSPLVNDRITRRIVN